MFESQTWLQHWLFDMQKFPGGAQARPPPHTLLMQSLRQQSADDAHIARSGPQGGGGGPPQTFARQFRSQQSCGELQKAPEGLHFAGPHKPSLHRNEQHSSGVLHFTPSGRQGGGPPQIPTLQMPAQHSPSIEHRLPSVLHTGAPAPPPMATLPPLPPSIPPLPPPVPPESSIFRGERLPQPATPRAIASANPKSTPARLMRPPRRTQRLSD
jgi:hypothetical protein